MATAFERLRHPLALRPRFEQDPHPGPPVKHGHELSPARRDAPVHDDRTVLADHPNLTALQMEINGTIFHGWLLLCASSALLITSASIRSKDSQPLHLISV